MSAEVREIRAYVRRDDLGWWAGCEYADKGPFDSYIREESCITHRGARRKARRLAKSARRLRDGGLAGYKGWVGEPA